MIVVVDFGSQYSQLIARGMREMGVFAEIVPFKKAKSISNKDLDGVVLSGGQYSVHDENAPKCDKSLFDLGVPYLGVCYGMQHIAEIYGGDVTPTDKREYGRTTVNLTKEKSRLLDAVSNGFDSWMSHGDIVNEAPAGFRVTSRSSSGHISSMENPDSRIYGVQFHPEVSHTEYGSQILQNFINICGAQKTWDPTKDYERIMDETREKLTGKKGVGGISGGIDSTMVSLVVNSLTDDYHPIFVDNGFLRLNEAEEVMASLRPLGLDVRHVEAGEGFLRLLQGVSDPQEKRRRIGHEFVRVFQEEANKEGKADYLVQGTLYPDVIESVPLWGESSVIKYHHNVGGLPEEMDLEVIEPLRYFFKDEARKIALEKLGMPEDIVWRHPFPGPGLAVRVLGEVTSERLDILRKADAIFVDEIKSRGLYRKMGQAFAGLTEARARGVMGDEGTYQNMILLRAVVTDDFMTSDVFPFEHRDIMGISNRIVNEVPGVNHVLYDISTKPPSTIEWE